MDNTIIQKSRDKSFEAFWQYREEVLNRQLEFYGIPAKISLKTDIERSLFIETIRELEEENSSDQKDNSAVINDLRTEILQLETHFVNDRPYISLTDAVKLINKHK